MIKHVTEEPAVATPEPEADVDVAIIGAGPAGLSAALFAQRRGLTFVVIEREEMVLSTIEAYAADKDVHLYPNGGKVYSGLPVDAARMKKSEALRIWTEVVRRSGVVRNIRLGESCRAVRRSEGGDYFTVLAERGARKDSLTYRARRVVLALGNRSAPTKLRVPGEELTVTRDGATEDKVKYKLSDPGAYHRKKIIVVGAGNSAVEAVVGLVARRCGEELIFRSHGETNEVTLVVRGELKNDLRLANKIDLFECVEEGKLTVKFNTVVKEIRADDVVLETRAGAVLSMDVGDTEGGETRIKNDFIFAMIGGNFPTEFLAAAGVQIG